MATEIPGGDDPQWFVVPAGTPVARCKSQNCRKPIYWIKHPFTEKPHPIDVLVNGGLAPSRHAKLDAQPGLFDTVVEGPVVDPYDGRGVSHFDTCPDAHLFRRGIGD